MPKKKILIIEDDSSVKEILTRFLKNEGYAIFHASDGEDGFDQSLIHKPDLIITDIILPIKDGLALLVELNKNPETKDILKMVLTNVDDKEIVQKAFKNGAVSYCIKTRYKLKEIAEEIKKILFPQKKKLPPKGRNSKKNLVVMLNDDGFILGIFKRIFEEKGFLFEGRESIPLSGVAKELAALKPWVLVVDLVMCLDGIRVIKEARSNSELKNTPIVAVDNLYSQEEIEGAYRAGVDAYVSMSEYVPSCAVEEIIRVAEEKIKKNQEKRGK
jgi:DNA-binding response OmpR family regulator